MEYFLYTRPERNDNRYEDPKPEMNDNTFMLAETSFGDGKSYLCEITSDDPNLTGKLNSYSEYQRKPKTTETALLRCNQNIEHKEGEDFTLVD